MTLGERLRAVRKDRGMTQREVAEICGMADSAIRKYESDKQMPKMKTLQRLADALGIPWIFLIDPVAAFSDALHDGFVDSEAIARQMNISEDIVKAIIDGAKRGEKGEDSALYEQVATIGALLSYDSKYRIYRSTSREMQRLMGMLNNEGKKKALERVLELTEIPRYKY